MSPDQHARRELRDLLHAAGAEERAAAEPLDVAGLVGRAHRRRAVRGTGYSALGVATAAAVTLGIASADGLWRTDRPLPPADSPTSSPTAWTGAWPSAITLDGAVPACGEPMPASVVPDGDPQLFLEPMTQGGALVAGGAAQLDVTVHGPDGFMINAADTEVVLVRDGVVVATEAARSSDPGIVYSGEGTVGRPLQVLELVRCETQGRGAVPLDAGAYDLYRLQDVLLGDVSVSRTEDLERRTIVDGPYDVTLEPADG